MTRHKVFRTGTATVKETIDSAEGDGDVEIVAVNSWSEWRCLCGDIFEDEEAAWAHLQD